jgi:hypothetical protein
MPIGMMGQTGRPTLLNFAGCISVGHGGPSELPVKEVPIMATQVKTPQPEGQPIFAAKIWHWRAKKFLYARDYGFTAFPIRRNRKS